MANQVAEAVDDVAVLELQHALGAIGHIVLVGDHQDRHALAMQVVEEIQHLPGRA